MFVAEGFCDKNTMWLQRRQENETRMTMQTPINKFARLIRGRICFELCKCGYLQSEHAQTDNPFPCERFTFVKYVSEIEAIAIIKENHQETFEPKSKEDQVI